jgi:hypothetical protein
VLLERLHLVQSGQAIGQIEDANFSTAHYLRIRLHGWMAALMCADVFGAIILSLIIFNVYAEPLNYAQTQLWAGLGGFVVAWGVAPFAGPLRARHHILRPPPAVFEDGRELCHRLRLVAAAGVRI